MSGPLLSIVLPVYNVAPYLAQCLDSLLMQSPAPDEIIAVDDGSTDDCPRILAEYARKMPNLRVIRRENGGLSAARNTGLAEARGKYLAFLDSDDFLSANAYARALAVAEEEDLELVLFNGLYHFEGRKPERPIYPDSIASEVVPGREWLRRRLESGRLLHMVWLHLYRREFIERQGLRFIPGLIHEDVVWTTRALLAAQRVRALDQCVVHYRIPIRQFAPEANQRRLERIVDSSEINARLLAEIAAEVGDPALRRLLSWQLVDGAFALFHKLEKMPDASKAAIYWRKLRATGFFALLWRHAGDWRQRRRLLRLWLTSFWAGRSA